MRPHPLACLLLAAALAPAARAALEFSGYTTARDGLRFIVTDLDTKKTSDWLRPGDTFQEHRIAGFDARTETLTVEHAGATLRLPLKGARTTSPTPAPATRPATARQVELSIDAAGGIFLSSISSGSGSPPGGSSPGGNLPGVSLNSTSAGGRPPLTDDMLRTLFSALAKMEGAFAVYIRTPAPSSEPAAAILAASRKAMEMARAAGATVVSTRLTNAPLTERADASAVAAPKPAP